MKIDLIPRLWRRVSLAGRLMIVSGSVLLALGIGYSNVVVRNEIDFHSSDLRQNLQYELEFLLPAISEPAVTGDYAQIKQMIDSRALQQDVALIRWTDPRGSVIVSRGKEIDAEAPEWFKEWIAFPTLTEHADLIVGGEPYGRIEVELTTTPAENKIWEALQKKLELLLFGIGAMFALTLTVATNGLKPLYTLQAVALRFGQGEHTARMPPVELPELSAVVLAFNSMADNIEELLSSLRESDARNRMLAVIVEQSNVAIITKDLNGIVTSWNDAASAVYGYTPDEVIGQTIQRFFVSCSDVEFAAALDRMRRAASLSFEARRVAKSGRVLDVHVSVSPLYDEKGLHIGEISVIRDITRQKRAEEALFEEKERAQVTLASIGDAVITTDTDGNIEYLNRVSEQLLGWELSEAYGHALPAIFHAVVENTGVAIPNPVEQAL